MNRITINDVLYLGSEMLTEDGQDMYGDIIIRENNTSVNESNPFYGNVEASFYFGMRDNKVPFYLYDDATKTLYLSYGVKGDNGNVSITNGKTQYVSYTVDFYYKLNYAKNLDTGNTNLNPGGRWVENILIDGSVINFGDKGCTYLCLPFPIFDINDLDKVKDYVRDGNRDGQLVEKPDWIHWKLVMDNTTGICHVVTEIHDKINSKTPFNLFIKRGESSLQEGEILTESIGNMDSWIDLGFAVRNEAPNYISCIAYNLENELICYVDVEFHDGIGSVVNPIRNDVQQAKMPPNLIEFVQMNVDENSTP